MPSCQAEAKKSLRLDNYSILLSKKRDLGQGQALKIKTLENFFEKSFPNLSKNFYLKPRCGFRKASCFFISRKLNVLALTNSREARVCVRGRASARSSGDKGQEQNLGKLF
jgi:hypothetical protein